MRTLSHAISSPKKAVNLRIDSELLRRAKQYHINLSKNLEEMLEKLLQSISQQEWLDENQKAIRQYNERVEQKGVFSDNVRQF